MKKKSAKSKNALMNLAANLKWAVDYTYESYICSGCSGCRNNDDFCRGSEYHGLKAKPDSAALVDCVLEETSFADDSLLRFILNQLFRIMNLDDPDSYYVTTCRGYYGAEINGVYIQNPENAQFQLDRIMKLPDNLARLNAVMEMEYGVFHKCPFQSAVIETINKDDLFVPNLGYLKKIDSKPNDYDLPIVLVERQEEGFKLLDGYHRYKDHDKQEILAVVVTY